MSTLLKELYNALQNDGKCKNITNTQLSNTHTTNHKDANTIDDNTLNIMKSTGICNDDIAIHPDSESVTFTGKEWNNLQL